MIALDEPSDARWTSIIILLLLVVLGVVHYMPGSGVQAKLDLSEGIENDRFAASQKRALWRLSVGQFRAFQWAMGKANGSDVKARYGAHPTIREVTIGEIMRAADGEAAKISLFKAWLAKQDQAMVARGQEQLDISNKARLAKLQALDAYKPLLVDVERQKSYGGNFIVLSYRLPLPESTGVRQLPCSVIYGPKSVSSTTEIDFDCLFAYSENGIYQVRLPDVLGYELSDMNFELGASFDKALTANERLIPGLDDDVAQAPEVVAGYAKPPTLANIEDCLNRLQFARKRMKEALDYKSEF